MPIVFSMSTREDALRDFKEKLRRFENDPLNESLALDCAIAGWAIPDWMSAGKSTQMRKRYREKMADACDQLKIVRDLANLRKHGQIKSDVMVTASEVRYGDFVVEDFDPNDFVVSRLVVRTDEGEIDLIDVLISVEQYFDELTGDLSSNKAHSV